MKIKKEILSFMTSTFFVVLTSSIVGLGVWMLNGNFIASIILSIVIQYVMFSFIGNIINNYFREITRQKELEKLEQLSSILECAYCKKHNVITFIPDDNERVEFVCTSCNKKNLVTINFTVSRITEPIMNTNLSSDLKVN